MREPASQVLAERGHPAADLQRPIAFSLMAHGLGIVALVVAPDVWLPGSPDAVPEAMTIRLGGPSGPGEGGLTPMGGQPIQEVLPVEEAARPQWIQPPADTAPEVIIPEDEARRLEPESEIRSAPDEARGRQLTRGPRLQDGSTMADTGVTGMGVGLSTGGLGGSGSEVALSDFCCPDYLATMMSLIRQRWDSNQRATGRSVIKFTIQTDGTIEAVDVERSSGFLALDQSARRAVLLTGQLPRLPSEFPEDNLIVRLTFEYRP